MQKRAGHGRKFWFQNVQIQCPYVCARDQIENVRVVESAQRSPRANIELHQRGESLKKAEAERKMSVNPAATNFSPLAQHRPA